MLILKEVGWLSWGEVIGTALYSINIQTYAAYDFSCVIVGHACYVDVHFPCHSVWRILRYKNAGK
jgi:hypothetical protein